MRALLGMRVGAVITLNFTAQLCHNSKKTSQFSSVISTPTLWYLLLSLCLLSSWFVHISGVEEMYQAYKIVSCRAELKDLTWFHKTMYGSGGWLAEFSVDTQ